VLVCDGRVKAGCATIITTTFFGYFVFNHSDIVSFELCVRYRSVWIFCSHQQHHSTSSCAIIIWLSWNYIKYGWFMFTAVANGCWWMWRRILLNKRPMIHQILEINIQFDKKMYCHYEIDGQMVN
jgi:hypothetical protein